MLQNIEELVSHIRANLPKTETLKMLKQDEGGQFVTFHWNSTSFLMKKNFETFELKNERLFTTGASVLVQSALSFESRSHNTLASCADALGEVRSLLNSGETEKGLKLLSVVKTTLSRLTRKKQISRSGLR